jgi:zinc transporter 1/2/3
MDLNGLKWLFLAIIFAISVISGFTTLHIANRYRKLVALGEALANGIFIGAAAFHLLPDAINSFTTSHNALPYLYAIVIAAASFVALVLIESHVTSRIANYKHIARVGPLLLTLSIHAFITGLALGISSSYVVVISLLIAILAHKAFEMFALVINLHRQIKQKNHIRLLFFLFAFITPIGILLGASGNALLPLNDSSVLTAYFNSVCAGTFFYIATVHSHHRHHPNGDGYQRYEQVLMTLLGVVLMGILAIWI